MKTLKLIILTKLLIVIILSGSCGKDKFPGYRIIEKRFVQEVNAECYLLEHEKSGALILKIAADDANKSFSIAFRTTPETDAGIPHIMEHSVLNGSKNFPVKSPFDVLLKGSLNTFLNAMTYTDFTVYPVASMNKADYFNLMNVYLDAVFNPLIYEDKRIFMQEGWHYELTSPEDKLIYKGVVYNEMKGAFSSPTRELWYQIQKNLFPETAYGNSSGGYPAAIPSLTYEDFINFHNKYYHPSNSLIMLYGDADLTEELAFIDSEYLANYERQEAPSKIPLSQPFNEIREASAYYPVIEGSPLNDQTYLAMSWVTGNGDDQQLVMSLELIADVLFNQESAPVRLALQEAGVGKDVSAMIDNLQQNIFTVIVQNANPGQKDQFRSIVLDVMEKIANEGIDKEALEGSLNRMEFRLREGSDANTGINHSIRSIAGWMYAGDPFVSLEYGKPLEAEKKLYRENYLEGLIKSNLLNNKFGVILTLEPKEGLENQVAQETSEILAAIKATMSGEQIDSIIKITNELIAFQNKEDSPEAIASIPMLSLTDISRETPWYQVEEASIAGTPMLVHKSFTNNIIYTNFWFDLRVLPPDMIPYATILAEVLGKMDTDSLSFAQLEKSININTGGLGSSLSVFVPEKDDNRMLPKFAIRMKTTAEKLEASISLLEHIVNSTEFDNPARLRELLSRHQANVEAAMRDGYNVAVSRFSSYVSKRGVLSDLTGGVTYYWFLTDLLKTYDSDPSAVISKLKETATLLFNSGNLICAVNAGDEDVENATGSIEHLVNSLNNSTLAYNDWNLDPVARNEGFVTASKVQYVIKGFDYKKLGQEWSGKWYVLNQVLSTDWLQTRIRVIGGAYGGWTGINRNGVVYFASYRDPNLRETLDNYDATIGYLNDFNADSVAMTRYIIGTIAGIDSPLTPYEKGEVAFRRYMEKVTLAELQKEREEILDTKAQDIRNFSNAISGILNQDVLCVYGNEEKLKQNKDLFKELVVLQK